MIVQLADYAALYTGNFIYSIIGISKKIKQTRGEETLAIFPIEAKIAEWINLLTDNDIKTCFIDMNLSSKERINKIKDIIDDDKDIPTIIHTHFARFEMDSIELKKYYRSKLIHHKHMGFTRDTLKYKLFDLYKFRFLVNKYVDKIVPVSNHVKDIMIKSGCKREIIEVIPNGIFVDKHLISNEKRKFARQSYNIDHKDKVILLFGYDIKTKGTDILLETIKYLIGDFKVIFVGRDQMKNYIKNSEIYNEFKEKIILIEHMEDVSMLFNMSDIFVSASRVEACSYAIGEAMLYELPIIMSDIKGNLLYEEAGEGVFLFKSEDILDLSEKINMLLSDEGKKYSSNRNFILENCNISNWSDKILRLYNDVLD